MLACAPDPVPTAPTDVGTDTRASSALRGESERTPLKDRQYLRVRLHPNAPAGDYTLSITTRIKDAYNRFGAVVNPWDISVCTGDALTDPRGDPGTNAPGGCGGGGGDDVP